ncbi:cytochrome P450 [Nocardia sp. NPDC059239]|uniref:cytochrome P450 n=1 Tax=Nocardia sp. NPDC059239 TaxID=3346785 RepID=UPI00367EB47F
MLTEQELLATCITTFVAGHETTANLIGTGMLRLLRAPDQIQAMRDRPELTASAPDELLRLEPSVQITTRAATRPITVAGHDFEPGEGVVVLINSANHDERVFPDPDRTNVARYSDPMHPAKKHLGFSLGIHYCLGGPWPCWRWRSCSTCCCAKSVRWGWFRRIHRSSRTWPGSRSIRCCRATGFAV